MSCIGGGLGTSSNIVIDNCYFETVNTSIDSRYHCDVSYHNGLDSNIRSNIHVSNSYFSHTFRVSYYGNSDLVSIANVNNCSFGSVMITDQEVVGYNKQNIQIVGFLNEVRT